MDRNSPLSPPVARARNGRLRPPSTRLRGQAGHVARDPAHGRVGAPQLSELSVASGRPGPGSEQRSDAMTVLSQRSRCGRLTDSVQLQTIMNQASPASCKPVRRHAHAECDASFSQARSCTRTRIEPHRAIVSTSTVRPRRHGRRRPAPGSRLLAQLELVGQPFAKSGVAEPGSFRVTLRRFVSA